MTPSELKSLLEPYGISPLKARGQHFLLAGTVVEAMVADVRAGEVVMEIGPGPGILTEALLQKGARVIAVELDPKLCELQKARFGAMPGYALHCGDVREAANASLLAEAGAAAAPYRVIANIPYGITSELVTRFLTQEPLPQAMRLMVQKEVGERIAAQPGSMSSLAVFVQSLARPRLMLGVPKGSFLPPPEVDSCVIDIALKTEGELAAFFGSVPRERFFRMVRTGFSQKRKKLANTLAGMFGSREALLAAFAAASVDPGARPEDLAVDAWAALVRQLP